MEKKLFRNEHNRVLAGVSSGLAEYMQVDVTIIRLLFVLSAIFLVGTGILVYIIMWIIVPTNNDPIARYTKFNEYYQKTQQDPSMFNATNAFNNPANPTNDQTKWNTPNAGADFKKTDDMNNLNQFPKTNDTGRTIGGLILLILGFYFLLRQFDIIPHWINIFKIYKLWPLVFVAIGISLIFKNQRKNEWETFKKTTEEAQKTATPTPVEDATIVEENKDSATPNS